MSLVIKHETFAQPDVSHVLNNYNICTEYFKKQRSKLGALLCTKIKNKIKQFNILQ